MSFLPKSKILSRKSMSKLCRNVYSNIQRKFFSAKTTDDSTIDNFEEALSLRSTWEKFHKEKCYFEWLVDPLSIHGYLMQHILSYAKCSSAVNILEIGCGTSSLSLNLFRSIQDYPVKIIAIDYAKSAVENMSEQYKIDTTGGHESSKFEILEADAGNLPFRDNSIDLVIDKGTVDSVLKDRRNGTKMARDISIETLRVLKCGGHFCQITDEDPELRIGLWDSFKLYSSYKWQINYKVLSENLYAENFMYSICKLK
ncbi:citrate synthase-lysine N-methyltransferase CSKMT, mitochondrial-like [Tubulanus polymorphus]|uniref:citrate synthase-lysine N-methyltransferase CSKMT, mitochondrial-like n=1 Tax=Tubulanus polymorphus TaxID=672921 RepID=UPI003DA46BB1